MAEILFANNASSYLKNEISSTDTSLQVYDGTGVLFPEPQTDEFFFITLQHPQNLYYEIVKCYSRTGDTFLIERGQEDTKPYAFPKDSYIELRLTKGGLDHIKRQIVTHNEYQEYTFTNTNQVVIQHNLNKYVNVIIIESGSNQQILADITYLDKNTVQIDFSMNLSGIIAIS